MALLYWLPMTDGTVKNQGLSGATPTVMGSVASNNSGKLGKCVQFGTAAGRINIDPSVMTGLSECTVCFWLNILSWQTNYDTVFQAGLGTSPWNSYVFGILRNVGSFLTTALSTTTSSTFNYRTSNLDLNTWYHLAFSYKAGHLLVYINGVLYSDYTTTTVPAFDKITYITIGSVNNGSYQCNMLMNDFRIYDTAISPRLVKLLSQGLVLHYPLDHDGVGVDNLLTNSSFSKNLTGWIASGTNGIVLQDGYRCLHIPGALKTTKYIWQNITSAVSDKSTDQLYTISADIRVDNIVQGTTNPMCGFYFGGSYDNNGTSAWLGATYISGTTAFYNLSNTGWHRLYVVTRFAHVPTNMGAHIYIRDITGDVYVKNVKFELGDTATPWCPNSADTQYAELGLNSDIEYDVSGFGYNGIKNNITVDSDTPKYNTCYKLNGSSSYIKCDTSDWMVQGAEEMTYSFWAYSIDWTTYYNRMISCTESGGFNIEPGASGYVRFLICCYSNANHTSGTYYYNNQGLKLSDLTVGWHMITYVYTTTSQKIYIDGELYDTYSQTTYGIRFNTGARLFLGCEANTYLPHAPYFNGKLSDFRLYATALSAEDVAELYHTPISLANDGTLFAAQFVES